MHRLIITTLAFALCGFAVAEETEDPYLWLEEIQGEKALDWVTKRSAQDTATLEAVPVFAEIHDTLLEIYNSSDRIPGPGIRGAWIYNYWRDAEHVRGIWRRTFLDEYVKEEPSWETVLDLDALAEAEDENWVWKGASCLSPEYRRCIVTLSRGGSDAAVRREFDTVAKAFVEDGFYLPEAKARVSWKDADTIWVGTDFGEGSLTTSGYPRVAKEWKRDTPLDDAVTVFTGSVDDVASSAFSMHTPEGRYDLVQQTPEYYRGTSFLMLGGRLVKLDIPEDAEIAGFFKDQILVTLRSDWETGETTFPGGSLLAMDLDAYLAGSRDFEMLFEPEQRVSFRGLGTTRNTLLYTTLDNVRGRLYRLTLAENEWQKQEIALPGLGTVGVSSTSDVDDSFFFYYSGFLTPSSLYFVPDGGEPTVVKSSPSWFDPEDMSVEQYEVSSADGVMIPYFVVKPKGFVADGAAPTLLYGYGGFEISMLPSYLGSKGPAWVSRGGVYVLANIRGGGEFGPAWHMASVKQNHQRNFDDFTAIAEDLDRTQDHLSRAPGHHGRLAGRPAGGRQLRAASRALQGRGLRRPAAGHEALQQAARRRELDGRVRQPRHRRLGLHQDLVAVPQPRSRRRTTPKVFFYTSTLDDRVHPAHARKMVAKMTDMGKKVYYYENTEGGHAAGANLNQRAYSGALSYAYLWMMLE